MEGSRSHRTVEPEPAELIARARAMIPTLAKRAIEQKHRRSVLPETIADMQAAGLFRVLQPRRWGGYEMDLPTFYEVQLALAQGDMSSAWIYGVCGVHPWFMALLAEPAAEEVWARDNSTLICSSLMPAGNAVAAHARDAAIEIIGAEAALYPSFWNALHGEKRPCGGPTLAEGIAVENVGRIALPLVRDLVSEIVLVDEAHLERAVNAYLTLQKSMAEGAGAAGLAAMLVKPEKFRARKVGLILCGGNIDPRILASVMVRELEREDRIVSFRLTIPDRPGVLGHIATRLGELGANILEVDHRRLFLDVPAKGAKLDVTMETRDQAHAEEIFRALEAEALHPVWIDTASTME